MQILTERKEWKALAEHQREIASQHMRGWFEQDPGRYERFTLAAGDILLDYSRNRITSATMTLLGNLAAAVGLRDKIKELFSGGSINISENRPALHTALRDVSQSAISINGENIAVLIAGTQDRLKQLTDSIHARMRLGCTGKPLSHIVNIGIGGSYTGPMMAIHALKDYAAGGLSFHFISSVDKAHVDDVLAHVDPETTLFIISSKSFNTIETLINADTVLQWMKQKLGDDVLQKHFIAVTAAADKARAFGIAENNIFPIWDWVGGRYSIWSAIGLPLRIMLGNARFDEFLHGAYQMDQHFRQADFAENLPVILAMLGIWYSNFFGAKAHAIVPYPHRLRYLVAYLQQADMESNGKITSLNGEELAYSTGPVLFGEEGVIGQHAYHQLLHQGSHLIPVDFILAGEDSDAHQDVLLASALSQAQALMRGKTYEEAYAEARAAGKSEQEAARMAKHKLIPGNKPCNILLLDRLSPASLGALLALYEHKIFVQGAVWGINSFDQWGVELGKQLLPDILRRIQDCERSGLMEFYSALSGSVFSLK